jgi:two-component system response regulator FixJ
MTASTILVVDDDEAVRDSLQVLLESAGYAAKPVDAACLVADIRMPEMDGLALQEEITRRALGLPVIFVTGHGDVALAVRAMKAGSVDFIEKPYDESVLLDSVARAVAAHQHNAHADAERKMAAERIAELTPREQQVLQQLVAGRPNKVIAFKLDISPRTVEVHRARIMEKLQIRSLSDLVRMSLVAGVEAASN